MRPRRCCCGGAQRTERSGHRHARGHVTLLPDTRGQECSPHTDWPAHLASATAMISSGRPAAGGGEPDTQRSRLHGRSSLDLGEQDSLVGRDARDRGAAAVPRVMVNKATEETVCPCSPLTPVTARINRWQIQQTQLAALFLPYGVNPNVVQVWSPPPKVPGGS